MPEWKLILIVGLPRSGKSTWAFVQGFPIVNRDAIRIALHGQPFIGQAEDMVTAIETYMVRALFEGSHNTVIVDATHLRKKYRDRWLYGPWNVELKVIDTPIAVCIERAKEDNREDLIPIIERMYENAEWPDDSDPNFNF